METKVSALRIQNLCRLLGFDNYFALDHEVGCEGIVIMWQNEACWDVINVSNVCLGECHRSIRLLLEPLALPLSC